MRNCLLACLALGLLSLISPSRATACGYNWIGECSSSVHLRINGSLDSFTIADCPFGVPYNTLHLGTLKTLSLANAKAITWESCINNVSAVGLQYRLYEQGNPVGGFQNLALNQDFFTFDGTYTTRYRSKPSNIDLRTGLTVGKTYVLEVFFLAEIDTIGDDNIPETTLLRNNGGQNYHLTFTYGGPAAHPFVAIPSIVQTPKCHGETNGSIKISVWGDQTGLFYDWSNINLNFYQQNNLPTGTYTVTVTGANHVETVTVPLPEPSLLEAQFSNVQPVACGAGVGAATVLPSGGTPPYRYTWQNGQTTATANFPNSGAYAVTLIDAHDCVLSKTVQIPGSGSIQKNESRSLCAGESFQIGNLLIDAPGVYQILIPGNGGCDTSLTLTVNEIDPGVLLQPLPSNILITCNNPSLDLCATASPEAQFQWSKDGILATQTPCLLATAGGTYRLEARIGDCVAAKNILSEEHLVPPISSITGTLVLTCNPTPMPTLLHANTNASNPSFLWVYDGQVLSTSDSCWFTITEFNNVPPFPTPVLPTLTVTDEFGCDGNAAGMLQITTSIDIPFIFFEVQVASDDLAADGMITVLASGTPPFTAVWDNGATGLVLNGLLPGNYCVTVTSANDCSTTDCVEVGVAVATEEQAQSLLRISPNPVAGGAWIDISCNEGVWSENVWLELVDASGRKVVSEQVTASSGRVRWPLPEHLQAGVFTLCISSKSGQICGKLLVRV